MANLRVDKITSTETFETTGSVQFDGNSDYLETDKAPFQMLHKLTSSWTIESWIYLENPNDQSTVFDTGGASSTTIGLSLYIDSQIKFRLRQALSSLDVSITVDHNMNYESWHHLSVTFDYDTKIIRIFVDGKIVGSATYGTESSTDSNRNFKIGAYEFGAGPTIDGYFYGHISNMRVIDGKALYTSNFKPSMRELEVVPGTVLLACQSKTDASLEKTGKTITVNGTAVASELTPGILTPVPKAGAGSAITGSVEFGGNRNYLEVDLSDDAIGTDEFTIEMWVNPGETSFTATNRRIIRIGPNNNANNIQILYNVGNSNFEVDNGTNELINPGITTVATQSWSHVALTRQGTNNLKLFVNGVEDTATTTSADISQTTVQIGDESTLTPSLGFIGFISNLRIVKGTALYTDDFIPPTRELKRVPGTVLLCCQDPDDPTQEVTGKTISLNGIYTYDTVVNSGITTAPTPSNFTPQVGDDRKVTFDGVTKINSDAYFYLPTGDTVTRDTGSGRGLFGGGDPSRTNSIEYIQIQSTGNGLDFGDLIEGRDKVGAGGNRTRGIWAGGDPSSNTISYVTIATRGNAENFGDLAYDGWGIGAAANTTRWLGIGGYNMNHISYVTISSTGDALDFGDLLVADRHYKASGSPTRCLMFNRDPGQDIQFVTWASTGNATNFGEMTSGTQGHSGTCSDPTRVIRFGGRDSPGGNKINMINYVTISSLGDEQDFGDLTVVSYDGDAVSNSIRGVHHIGDSGSVTNAVDYVTIQTTGNAQDFGDLTRGRLLFGTASDSQGAIA